MSGVDLAAVITAIGVFLTTLVGAIVTLKHEFQKAYTKIDDVQSTVNHVETKVDNVETKVDNVQNVVNGGTT